MYLYIYAAKLPKSLWFKKLLGKVFLMVIVNLLVLYEMRGIFYALWDGKRWKMRNLTAVVLAQILASGKNKPDIKILVVLKIVHIIQIFIHDRVKIA